MYSLLEDHIKQPRFLKQLEEAKEANKEPDACPHGSEVFQEEWWEAPKGAAVMDSDEGFLEVPTTSPAAFLSTFNLPIQGAHCMTASEKRLHDTSRLAILSGCVTSLKAAKGLATQD